jgi:hypothetical protein
LFRTKFIDKNETHILRSNCTTTAFGDEPRRMLKIIQRFGKYCSCHLQCEYVMVGCFDGLVCTLKMATAMFAETLDNFQHSTRLISESRSCAQNVIISHDDYKENEDLKSFFFEQRNIAV